MIDLILDANLMQFELKLNEYLLGGLQDFENEKACDFFGLELSSFAVDEGPAVAAMAATAGPSSTANEDSSSPKKSQAFSFSKSYNPPSKYSFNLSSNCIKFASKIRSIIRFTFLVSYIDLFHLINQYVKMAFISHLWSRDVIFFQNS